MKRFLDPLWMRNIMLLMTFASIILWIAATITDWVDSKRFISHVSMAALVAAFGAWAAAEAIRLEQRRENTAEEVVEALVEETDVEPLKT